MKLLLPVASLTPEDAGIWLFVSSVLAARHQTRYFMRRCCESDRRDAAIMLLAQKSPKARFVYDSGLLVRAAIHDFYPPQAASEFVTLTMTRNELTILKEVCRGLVGQSGWCQRPANVRHVILWIAGR
jgi:hypothetical protein